jgi:hypothetical protein
MGQSLWRVKMPKYAMLFDTDKKTFSFTRNGEEVSPEPMGISGHCFRDFDGDNHYVISWTLENADGERVTTSVDYSKDGDKARTEASLFQDLPQDLGRLAKAKIDGEVLSRHMDRKRKKNKERKGKTHKKAYG